MKWIERHKEAAPDLSDAHLRAFEQWQREARAVADVASRHSNKKAVEEVTPGPAAAEALYGLFAKHAEDIWHTCREIHTKYVQSSHADEPGLSLDDLLQEAYPIFQRAMVRAEGKYQMLNRLEARMADYVRSQLVTHDDPGSRRDIEGSTAAADVDLVAMYDDLCTQNDVPDEAADLWEEIKPEAT